MINIEKYEIYQKEGYDIYFHKEKEKDYFIPIGFFAKRVSKGDITRTYDEINVIIMKDYEIYLQQKTIEWRNDILYLHSSLILTLPFEVKEIDEEIRTITKEKNLQISRNVSETGRHLEEDSKKPTLEEIVKRARMDQESLALNIIEFKKENKEEHEQLNNKIEIKYEELNGKIKEEIEDSHRTVESDFSFRTRVSKELINNIIFNWKKEHTSEDPRFICANIWKHYKNDIQWKDQPLLDAKKMEKRIVEDHLYIEGVIKYSKKYNVTPFTTLLDFTKNEIENLKEEFEMLNKNAYEFKKDDHEPEQKYWKKARELNIKNNKMLNNGKLICKICKKEILDNFELHHFQYNIKIYFGESGNEDYCGIVHEECHRKKHGRN